MDNKKIRGKELHMAGTYEEGANIYSIKCQFLTMIFPFITWILNCAGVFIVDKSLMFTSLLLSSVITAFTVIICSLIGMKNRITKYFAMAGIVMAIFVQAALLTYHTYLLVALPVIYSLQYGQRKMIYYTYILSIIGLAISVYVGYYAGLCDANMVVLTRGTMGEYVDASGTMFNAVPVNSNPALSLMLYFVLPRCMVLFATVLMVVHIADTIASKAANEEHLKHLSEIDDMTDVYNRNKYLDMIREYYPHIPEISVIFWDVNGLKYTNDNLGHESGDVLIKAVASSIIRAVDNAGLVYRIGGDEFVAIIEGDDKDKVEGIITRYNEIAGKKNENRFDGIEISASVGKAFGEGWNIEEIIKKADTHMYMQKKKYKKARI